MSSTTYSKKHSLLFRITASVFAAALAAALAGGCQTVPDDDDSELPWNTPQAWEASPSFPGMSGGGGNY